MHPLQTMRHLVRDLAISDFGVITVLGSAIAAIVVYVVKTLQLNNAHHHCSPDDPSCFNDIADRSLVLGVIFGGMALATLVALIVVFVGARRQTWQTNSGYRRFNIFTLILAAIIAVLTGAAVAV